MCIRKQRSELYQRLADLSRDPVTTVITLLVVCEYLVNIVQRVVFTLDIFKIRVESLRRTAFRVPSAI